MELVHEPASGEPAVLADEVSVADTWLARARGRMFTRSFPEGSALVFPFDGVGRRSLHMVGVPYAIDALFIVDETVTEAVRLRPMVGLAWGRADRIVELPSGAAEAVAVGDSVVLRNA